MSRFGWRRLWLFALCHASMAAADAPETRSNLSAADVFEVAERATVAGQAEEALGLYDALSADLDLEIRTEARFRKGQLLASLGRYRESATTYRRLLDEKPGAARVRLELAAVLARLGDEPGARRQLRLAQAAGLPPEVAEQVSQFSRALRSPQRLGGSLELSLAPDTNVNRATQARTLDTVIAPLLLDRDARATSGIGLRPRASVFAKQPLGAQVALVARASGSADLYRNGENNDVLGAGQLGVEWRGERDLVSLGYGVSRRWYGGRVFADIRTVNGQWLHQIDRVTQLTAGVSRGSIRYRQNALQDGVLYGASVSVERALSARSGVALGAEVSRQEALDPSYASVAYGPIAYGWHEWGRTTFFATVAAKRLIGDERNFLFTDKRREWFVSGRVGATMRRFSYCAFSPTIRFGVERNASTIAIYDYSRAYGEFGLSRSF